jgi:hypothetical protein
MEENPKPNEIWTHNNGIEYLVKYIANDDNNPKYPLTIIYQGVKNGKIWARELSDWHRSFKKKEAVEARISFLRMRVLRTFLERKESRRKIPKWTYPKWIYLPRLF